jgi:hypothetical protein
MNGHRTEAGVAYGSLNETPNPTIAITEDD